MPLIFEYKQSQKPLNILKILPALLAFSQKLSKKKPLKMSDESKESPFGPFFGVMGVSAAIIFSGQSRIVNFYKFLFFYLTIHSFWCGLWDREIRNWNCCNGRYASGTNNEVHYSCGYGWYHCHLRVGSFRFDRWSFGYSIQRIHALQVHSSLNARLSQPLTFF